MRRGVLIAVACVVVAIAGAVVARPFLRRRPDDGLPSRVWWQVQSDHSAEGIVSDRPGGEPIQGAWRGGWYCCDDDTPDQIWHAPSGQTANLDERTRVFYWHDVYAERHGVRWKLFTRPATRDDEPRAEDELRLVGRWRHQYGTKVVELELRDDGTGRDSDGTTWEWTAGELGLELTRQEGGGNVRYVYGCVLDPDLRRYQDRGDPRRFGVRIDDARSKK